MLTLQLILYGCADLECPPEQDLRGATCFTRDAADGAVVDGSTGDAAQDAGLADAGGADAQLVCNPATREVCNQRDDDCDGVVDEDVVSYGDYDGDGVGGTTVIQGCPREGVVAKSGDCDDRDPAIHPGATETCNGRDDNCDGTHDEGLLTVVYRDADGDTYGDSNLPASLCMGDGTPGYALRAGDCDDSCPSCSPANAAETTCDQKDDNCNGRVDENLVRSLILDCDGDYRFSPNARTATACTDHPLPQDCPKGRWYVASDLYTRDDCNDQDPAVYGCP